MKTKRSRKFFSILLTLSLLVAMLAPLGTAGAATGYRAYSVPSVDDDGWFTLGTVMVEIDPDALASDDTVIFSLPSGFEFAKAGATKVSVTDGYELSVAGDVYTRITAPATVSGDTNALQNTEFDIEWLDDNQIKVALSGYAPGSGVKAWLKIEMPKVYVDSGFSGDINLTADAPSSSGFPEGSVTVGRVGDGNVTITVVDDETSNNDFTVKLRIKESRAGALEAETDSIKLTLPDGFVWTTADGSITEKTVWGQNLALSVAVEDEELELALDAKSTQATCFEITLTFEVDDETEAEFGDVIAEVEGETDSTPTEIVVGKYADFGTTIKADGDVPEIFAGQADQDVVDLVIEEGMEGSLVKDRTVLLTLPSNARWRDIGSSDTDEGIKLEFVSLTGTDDRTAKFKVVGAPSSGEAKLTIEDITIDTEAGKEGDIAVKVSGSAGLSGEVIIAKAVAPVKIEVAKAADLLIGLGGQELGDVTITENVAGAILEDKKLVLDLPEGISFSAVPTVEVTAGDLKIGDYYRQNSAELTKDNQLAIEIDNDSDKPGSIKISNIKVSVDRTVPEGNVTLSVVGTAVNETGGKEGTTWPNARAVASAVAGKVLTPAPDALKANAVFTIGSTTYTLNGVEMTMDVAPYIKGDRTYLPVRYVAQALGVSESNIMWNPADQSVVMIKGDRVVKMTIGSTTMYINGVAFTMDVAPEIVDPGRTMLPFRFIAQALGASVAWDAATQTVSMNL